MWREQLPLVEIPAIEWGYTDIGTVSATRLLSKYLVHCNAAAMLGVVFDLTVS